MNQQNSKRLSWYRVPLIWFAVSVPLSTVLAGLLTYHRAAREHIDNDPDPVHRVAQIQTSDLAADEAALHRNLYAVATIDPISGTIVIDAPGIATENLNLRLIHATRAAFDSELPLHKTTQGFWTATLPSRRHGLYRIELIPTEANWRLSGQLRNDSQSIRLVSTLNASS